MRSYRARQMLRYFQFNNGLTWGMAVLLLVASISWTPFRFNVPLIYLAVFHISLSIIHTYLLTKIKKANFDADNQQLFMKVLEIILVLGIVGGNVFTFLSGMVSLKKVPDSGFIYSLYMVLVDVFVIVITGLNIFKPFVSNYFIPTLSILGFVLIYHIICMIWGHSWYRWDSKLKLLTFIFLLLTAVTGNILALFVAISMYIKNKDSNSERRQTSIIEKLTRNQAALMGMLFIAVLITIAITSNYSFSESFAVENNYASILQPPSIIYPFGTDSYGRDVFSRIIFGSQISLSIGLLSTFLPFFVGGSLGAISGFYGSRTDSLIMRLLDVLYAIPSMLLAITIVASFGASTTNLIIALSLGSIPSYARTMRANVMQVANYEYVEAARALGQSNWVLIRKHIIPNAMAPMIVRSTLTIGTAVIATSSLSYLGLGVEAHIPEWGNILRNGSQYLETNPYLAVYPGLAIILLVLSFNFLGDGLRDATDPKLN